MLQLYSFILSFEGLLELFEFLFLCWFWILNHEILILFTRLRLVP